MRRLVLTTALMLGIPALAACGSSHHPAAPSSSASASASDSAAGDQPTAPPAPDPAPAATGAADAPTGGSTGPGTINDVVPTVEPSQLPQVPLSDPASPADGITVQLTEVVGVDAVTHQPGQVSGPAVQITVRISNAGADAVAISSAQVAVADSAAAPGIAVTTDASSPFAGTLAPGASATGIYVFRVPADRRSPILVTVSYTAGGAVAQFTGNLG